MLAPAATPTPAAPRCGPGAQAARRTNPAGPLCPPGTTIRPLPRQAISKRRPRRRKHPGAADQELRPSQPKWPSSPLPTRGGSRQSPRGRPQARRLPHGGKRGSPRKPVVLHPSPQGGKRRASTQVRTPRTPNPSGWMSHTCLPPWGNRCRPYETAFIRKPSARVVHDSTLQQRWSWLFQPYLRIASHGWQAIIPGSLTVDDCNTSKPTGRYSAAQPASLCTLTMADVNQSYISQAD